MKAKISRGAGFRGVLDYTHDVGPKATGDKKPERVGGNMAGENVQELVREFGVTKKLRPDCKNAVWHCSLGLPEGDRLSPEKWGELARDFMLEMRMNPTNFLYDVVRHNDTKFDHIHITASRIGLDSSLWHGQNDVLLAIEATQNLEKKHGLTLTPGFDPKHKKDRKPITANELNMAIRLEIKPPRMVCQEAIDEVLKSKTGLSAPDFIERLSALDVRAVPSVASTGTMNGFSFENGGVAFTGSKLGESYKWLQLIKRGVGYDKTRDFEALAHTKRLAAARAGTQQPFGPSTGAVGPDDRASEQPAAVARSGSGASDAGFDIAGAVVTDARTGKQSTVGNRQNLSNAEGHAGGAGSRNEQPGSEGDGRENRSHGHGTGGSVQPGEGIGSEHESNAIEHAEISGASAGAVGNSKVFSAANAARIEGTAGGSAGGEAPISDAADAADGGGVPGRAPGGDWASRFKQASARKRAAGTSQFRANALESGNATGARVAESDRVAARQIDPTKYLELLGFEVKKDGQKNLSVSKHGDEIYRVTLKSDGHYVSCDRYENGIGDNIALVRHIEAGTGFAEAVYRLSGAPSVAKAMQPAAPESMRQPPIVPEQTEADVKRGRAYLVERGISLETIEHAEKTRMLRYSAGGVLFVGHDEAGTAQNIMRRSVDPLELVQKRDLKGTDKRHPQMLAGDLDTVWLVEGGTDALAAHDLAQRESRPVPTVLVTGGANVRGFLQTLWVQKILQFAKKVIVAFERESTPEAQAKTDAAHKVQLERLREVCSAQVEGWQPPEGVKDLAELNFQRPR